MGESTQKRRRLMLRSGAVGVVGAFVVSVVACATSDNEGIVERFGSSPDAQDASAVTDGREPSFSDSGELEAPPGFVPDGASFLTDDGGDAGGGCNTVAVFRDDETATRADVVVVRPPAQSSLGGTPGAARYLLLDALLYTTERDELEIVEPIGSISLELSGGTARFVRERPDKTLERANGSVVTTGSSFALTMTCGAASKFYGAVAGTTYTYDATFGYLILTVPMPSSKDPHAVLVMTYVQH